MGQAQFHNSYSELQNESLVEPAALGAVAILVVVAVAVEAILVAGVAAKVVVAVVEAVVGQAQVELVQERVAVGTGVVAVQVDGAQERRVWEAQLFFLLLGKR